MTAVVEIYGIKFQIGPLHFPVQSDHSVHVGHILPLCYQSRLCVSFVCGAFQRPLKVKITKENKKKEEIIIQLKRRQRRPHSLKLD